MVDGDGEVHGIVHAKDLLGVERTAYAETPITSLVHDFFAVPEAAGLSVVLTGLREHSTEMAVVIDEYGGMEGIVTLEDVLETLLGVEILDEGDTVPDMRKLARSMWRRRARSMGLEISDDT